MRSTFVPVVALAGIVAAAGAPAQSGQEHADHHAAARPSVPMAAKSSKPKAPAAASAPTPAEMGDQMQAMREMHDKMMAAKSPEERQALMADHMKAMQDGMAMMGRMQRGSGNDAAMPMQRQMMVKRMDMMQMMMQMMMDRDAATAPAAK